MELRVAVVYDGGLADTNLLSAYDAGISLAGFARAFAITGHALLYQGVPRRRAARVQGVEVLIAPSRPGSFEQELRVILSDPILALGVNMVASVATAALWDLVKWSWSAAVDKAAEPETDYLKDLINRKEPYLGQLPGALESSLRSAHRPIEGDSDVEIFVMNPDDPLGYAEVAHFDTETLDFISSKARDDDPVIVHGNVTRYNILSGIGRFYSQEDGKTVSFRLSPTLPDIQKPFITWSLDERARNRPGLLMLKVVRFVNGRGETKRYQIEAIQN